MHAIIHLLMLGLILVLAIVFYFCYSPLLGFAMVVLALLFTGLAETTVYKEPL